jgi:hypothetical protein
MGGASPRLDALCSTSCWVLCDSHSFQADVQGLQPANCLGNARYIVVEDRLSTVRMHMSSSLNRGGTVFGTDLAFEHAEQWQE